MTYGIFTPVRVRICATCRKDLLRYQSKYCSNLCQHEYQYERYIRAWKEGSVDGGRGLSTRNISRHLRKYLFEKYEGKCSQCGWNKLHPKTNVSPLEVDHIDGNSENNKETNLRLICPNCHSLSVNFRNHNKGKGRFREWKSIKRHRT